MINTKTVPLDALRMVFASVMVWRSKSAKGTCWNVSFSAAQVSHRRLHDECKLTVWKTPTCVIRSKEHRHKLRLSKVTGLQQRTGVSDSRQAHARKDR